MEREVKQTIGESIKVLASFEPHKIKIHFFSWRGRTYKVQRMNLFHLQRDGLEQRYHFAVSSQENAYQIAFNPKTLAWSLEDIVSL